MQHVVVVAVVVVVVAVVVVVVVAVGGGAYPRRLSSYQPPWQVRWVLLKDKMLTVEKALTKPVLGVGQY